MDEIICPECGRPNLVEAEKCWYCQILLVKTTGEETQTEEVLDSSVDNSTPENTKENFQGEEEPEQDLPEWLKRIRELKKADQPVEEVDQWQQEKLFTGQTEEKGKRTEHPEIPRRLVKSLREPDPKPVIPADQPLFEEAPAKENLQEQVESGDADSDHPENELPEGFTPLNT